MAEFNILTESFVVNVSGSTIPLNSVQMQQLLDGGANVSVSGGTISLLIDLGAQKSVDRLDYGFTPVTTTGVAISYGREASSLTAGVLNTVGQSLRVFPTTSGFDFPRFFKISHTLTSGISVNLNSLTVINDDVDVNFGQDGLLTSFPLVGEQSQEALTYELFVRNDGTIPTDMFVSLDTNGQSLDTLEKFTLSPTVTGTFLSFDTDIQVPTSVPWEWGFFDNSIISSDNKLSIINPNNPTSLLSVGTELGLSNSASNSNGGQVVGARNIQGQNVVVSPRTDHAFNFTNVFTNVRTVTSVPSHYTVSNADEQEWLHPAWDGDDKIYYLNGKATAEVQVYEISTDTHSTAISGLSFYNRQAKTMFYDAGDLIIMGALAAPSTSSDVGVLVRRVNIQSGAETVLQSMPTLIEDSRHQFAESPGAIYFNRGSTTKVLYRYNVDVNQWDILANDPDNSFVGGLAYNSLRDTVWLMKDINTYEYDVTTGQWNNTPIFQEMFPGVQTTAILFGGTTYYESSMGGGSAHKARVLGIPIELGDLSTAISGSWTSPVFRVADGEDFRRVLIELTNPDEVQVDLGNLASPTFEVRGSNLPPSSDNFIESFITTLDSDTWVTGIFGDVVASSTDNLLTFSHEGTVDAFASGYILLGLPLATSGKMQYKFWWNPSTDRLSGSTNFSGLYIAPFLDVLFGGKVAVRDPDSNQRTEDNYIYLKLSGDSDSGGSVSALEFYNGSTVSTFPINVGSGSFHEIALTIDWTSGDYTVDFVGSQIGNGNIPGFKRAQLESQHTIELFSGSEDVDADEKFKYLTVSRVGLEPASVEDRAFPTHRDDPLYGKAGSLVFKTTTIDSPLLPKTEYLQFKITMSTVLASPEQTPGISSLRFPPVITLPQVGVGESQPVYFKYNFDSTSEASTLELKLKAWMFTDKT